ncbi:protein FAR1-RELATED SEQUENCE 6-like [Juglans microcarpa x Juglans regia]|uniref:protein FAR1-RELATED SEQUENCE 6-like n=1 Tax=Juglans microcarpa x Juglans regia TaxID=2249226 RepID=UPI001B7E8F70|nr:protein FAR1-RELATED SEQUENCE 6-like [Juglans microcarpa x Juglans regia]
MVYFNEAEVDVKCSYTLFEMRGILCRHALAIMRVNKVKKVPEKYILDRWRKDIKRTYTLIRNTYDLVDARPEVSRYSHILKLCYDVATNAASCDKHAGDMIDKLYAMNIAYRTKKSPQRPLEHVADTTVDPLQNTTKVLDFSEIQHGDGAQPELHKALDETEDRGHVQD